MLTISLDQTAIIRKYHASAKQDLHTMSHLTSPFTMPTLSSNLLTRSRIIKQDYWKDWKASEFKNLDKHSDENIFGKPCSLARNQIFYP